ncbi:phage tail assembly chaperone [Klebsiella pneumoniae]|uniref:phage tail assembly chaperone n=1 Tax=Klebsiella pneumoniae TaxID=573 RepID=UPI0039C2B9E3
MHRILYNNDGSIVGCFERLADCSPLDDQSVVDLEITDEEWDNIFDYTIVNGNLVRQSDQAITDKRAAADLFELRLERDMKISATDWWVLPDQTPTQAQLDYRQALRDITDNYSSLDDVVWPEKP